MRLADKMLLNGGLSPGYHLMRHALAVFVLLLHGFFIVRGTGPVALVTEVNPAFVKAGLYERDGVSMFRYLQPLVMSLVASFFVLSGFLVAGSALRTRHVGTFFFNRAVRIFPALMSEVMLSALILGPLTTALSLKAYVQDPMFVRYLGNMFGFVSFELPGLFGTNPWPNMVNANLWTLPAEFYCYVILAALMASGLLFARRFMLVAILLVSVALCIEEATRTFGLQARSDVNHFSGWFIVYEFVLGATFRILADRIPYNGVFFAASAACYGAGIMTGAMDPVAGICLAYCTIYVGEMKFTLFDRWIKSDLSYGIYLYGFPISQGLTFLLKEKLGRLPLFVQEGLLLPLFLGLTIVFARLSWSLIEKPALRLKAMMRSGRDARAPVAVEQMSA